MPLILAVVFLAVFAVAILVLGAAAGRSAARETVRATLKSALLTASRRAAEEIVDLRKRSALSSIPWFDRLLARIRPAADLRLVLQQANVPWTLGRLLLTAVFVGTVVIYVVHFKTGNLALSFLLALVAGAVPFLWVLAKRERRFHLFLQKLPDAIDLMVSALRAGNSTLGALGIVASEAPEPIRGEFRICFDEQSYGVDLRAAMEHLVTRVPLPDVRIITTAILIQKESGGNLAEVLDKTAQVIRDRFRLLDQIRVHTAQGRLTCGVLSALPPVLVLVLLAIGGNYLEVLFTHPLGQRMIAAGVLLNVLGWLAIRKVIRILV